MVNFFRKNKNRIMDKANSNHIDYNKLFHKQTFDDLYNNHPDSVFRLDIQGNVINFNAATRNIFGYSDKEVYKNFSDNFSEESQSSREHFFREALRGVAQNYEAVIVHKKGHHVDVDITYIPILNQELGVIGVYGIAKDITSNKDTEKELIKIRNSLEMAQRLAKIGSWDYDILEDKVYWSEQLYQLLGIKHEKDFVPSANKILHFLHPDDREYYKLKFENAINNKQGYDMEYRFLLKDETVIYVHDQAKLITDSNQNPFRVIGTIQDISERKRAEIELKESEARFKNIYDNLEVGIWSFDVLKKSFILVSQGVEILSGVPSSSFTTLADWIAIIHPDDQNEFVSRQPKLSQGNTLYHEYRIVQENGEIIWVQDQTIPVLNKENKLFRIDGIITNVTSYKESEKIIKHLAYHDYLTDLPNQRMLDETIESLLRQSLNGNTSLALLNLNVDRFKAINDTLGHKIGDSLLKEFAKRISLILPNDTLFSRISGDEFAILLWNYEPGYPIQLTETIMDVVKEAFSVDEFELFVTTSVGIIQYPEDADTANALRRNASAALHRARDKGRNTYQIYAPSLNVAAYKLYTMEKDLRKSIAAKELFLVFQPRVEANTGKIVSAEALVRWEHSDWGVISPKEFIPLAEESGFISEIGDWVMEQVCMYIVRWEHKGLPSVPISINISAQSFLRNDWLAIIKKILNKSKVDPALIELEITESSLIHYQETISEGLQTLKALGVRIALDDFGTGYSSLSYLKDYPIDTIKIDKSFIDNIVDDVSDQTIISAVIQLAKGLKKRVVAEGVETAIQLEILKGYHCHEIQGYLFSKPLPDHEFQTVLQSKVLQPNSSNVLEENILQHKSAISFTFPLSAVMSLISIKGKNVQLGKTKVLVEKVTPVQLRFLSTINLPVRDDFIYHFTTTILGDELFLKGYIVWSQEVDNLYEYELVFIFEENENVKLERLFPKLSRLLAKNPILPNSDFVTEDKVQYLKLINN
ncbi:sensor domain-containing protein [Aquibacillus rhizosphaerae]|uniref:EAL domain-containing protein n=1 Tax=Aquibacillus rhizosphaerae TaxID=3051431 RepID=A0ABT7L8R7_9BACI|nr:EAL domain-containing protein [Aquibacillus sp. LR5S19]MDL4842249.1 EAL domain-containing protein [Aquibacillus sp. LR5S19]